MITTINQKLNLQMVRMLTFQELMYIANNITFSAHSCDRITNRYVADSPNKRFFEIIQKIKTSDFAYVNTDQSINIKITDTQYIVVVEKDNGSILAVTYKEKSKNNISLEEKYQLALRGKKRVS